MTRKNNSIQDLSNLELSIQLSLNGLSFCILNSDTNTIGSLKHFELEKRQTPFELLDTLKHIFNTESITGHAYDKVTLVYVNELSTLVPKALFNENAMADYLKLNAKILKTDFITFDDIAINDTVNVYVPYVNINNYIYEVFGCFTYKHFSTILIEQLLKVEKHSNDSKLYVNVFKTHFEIVAIDKGSLLLYNSFTYNTPEDFIYYVLFTIEQLQFNPETIPLILLGNIQKDDVLYGILYRYIRDVGFGNRFDSYSYTEELKGNHSDFTLIKSL